jgi:drug/metabolite transporter (DMT)-like permease
MRQKTAGLVNGLIGVLIFSASLPATRVAVLELDPLFVTTARAAIAGFAGLAVLVAFREKPPKPGTFLPLLVVAAGVVVGFPLLTALALKSITAAHATIFVGLLPLTTAIFAVLRGGERPKPAFWLFSVLGAVTVAGFAFLRAEGGTGWGDLLMMAAIIVCGLGYAEGARLSRSLGGWQVICWALVLSLPVMLPLAFPWAPETMQGVGWPAWTALAYVSFFSMLIGFFFWYKGLVQGGIAAVGQLQLLQPFFGLGLAALLLGEPIGWSVLAVAGAVVACVAGAKRFA